MRKTKIIATIGPASSDVETLKQLMLAGMNVARINFSHGSYEEQEDRINAIKQARAELNLPVALLLDTKGPEIRIGKVIDNKVTLIAGNQIILKNKEMLGNTKELSITYQNLYQEVSVGDKILINDGIIELRVNQIIQEDIICDIIHGGTISNRKSINVPDLKLNLPSLTDTDISDIKYGIKADFDFIAASFIRKPEDVLEIKKVLKENGGEKIKVISKIENREGVNNFQEILKVSDGIMVARGDLGVEIPEYEVPIIQKKLIKESNMAAKPVITATQMLESMVTNARPTRAEVSDIANAIYDMTSAIMLSAETASGKYPVECIKTMAQIAEETEKSIDYWQIFREKKYDLKEVHYELNVNHSVCTTAMNINAKAIFAYTLTGNIPRVLSGFLPQCPVFAILENEQTCRQVSLLWNAYPKLFEHQETIDKLVSKSVQRSKADGELQARDRIVIAGGSKLICDETARDYKLNKIIGGIIEI